MIQNKNPDLRMKEIRPAWPAHWSSHPPFMEFFILVPMKGVRMRSLLARQGWKVTSDASLHEIALWTNLYYRRFHKRRRCNLHPVDHLSRHLIYRWSVLKFRCLERWESKKFLTVRQCIILFISFFISAAVFMKLSWKKDSAAEDSVNFFWRIGV